MRHLLLILFCLGWGLKINAQNPKDIHHQITSDYFKEQRKIQVHLPAKYHKAERLPVIYVFDAQWSPYFKLTTSIIDYLIEIREFPRSIVVGIHSEKRQYELTPEPVNDDWKVPNLGGAKLLENHLVKEVIPLLKREYNTESFRIGIGHSLGGTFVLNSLADRPTLFNAYVAISPNLQIDDEEITLKIQRNLSKIKRLNKFVYTTIGTAGNPDAMFLPYVKKLDTIIRRHPSANFNWNFSIYPGFNHATSPIESIHKALLQLSKKWNISTQQKEEISKRVNVVAGFKGFYKDLSDWAGYTIVPSENDYDDFGGFLETRKKHLKALELYKDASKSFPSVSRYYNSIGENLIQLHRTKETAFYFKKALTIIEKESFEYAGSKNYFKKRYQENLKKVEE
jgi:hypothetical protein